MGGGARLWGSRTQLTILSPKSKRLDLKHSAPGGDGSGGFISHDKRTRIWIIAIRIIAEYSSFSRLTDDDGNVQGYTIRNESKDSFEESLWAWSGGAVLCGGAIHAAVKPKSYKYSRREADSTTCIKAVFSALANEST